jgi:hypothetical protein
MTFGAPAEGDILADRYRLEEHVDTDAASRQIWRGMDIVLKRPVAIVIRQPGGEAAAAMLDNAFAASRLVHPHLVSVYDAIDDGHRAYLIREWVSGIALRDVLRQAPLDAERATLVTHAVAEAVSALHAANIVHGNVHPGTILVADDGRVVLTDAHADGPAAEAESDVRAVGAVLYASLTGQWPHAEAGYSSLPDAVRDGNGRLATPRQVRGGIPSHLDEIAADLLDPRAEPPTSSALAAEFARLATEGAETDYDEELETGPMGFGTGEAGRRRVGGRLALGVAFLTAIAVVGALVGAKVLGGSSNSPDNIGDPAPVTSTAPAGTAGKPIAITADQVRVVDPPKGNRTETEGIQKVVDGNETTGWTTDQYKQANFGSIKPGMGILINLGRPTKVGAVRVVVSQQGGTMSLRSGTSDPGNTSDGDRAISTTYATVGQERVNSAGTVMVFPVPESQQSQQYLMLWITQLPLDTAKNVYVLSVNEITVFAP